MEKIKLNTKRCKGCYLCVSVCPVKALSPSGELGDETVKVDEEKCITCGSCYRMCPDYAIEILK